MIDRVRSGRSDDSNHHNTEDEAFPPLPPPFSPGQGGQDDRDFLGNGDEDGNEEGDVSKLAEVPAAKRKGVKRPQPKLDSQRLTSERGLPALRTLFDEVHFKGKGHEASDLQLLMQKMENWAHRLFPKLQFENFIDKVERLGNKKDVQTCLKRIRLDMPLTHEDFVGKDEEGAAAAADLHIFGEPDRFSGAGFPDEGPIHSTPAPAAPAPPAAASPAPPSLTEEQQRRVELNRRRALEKRLARQQQPPQLETGPADSQDVNTPEAEPTSASSAKVREEPDHQGGDDEAVMEDVELEPENSSVTNKPPPTDSEAPAESKQPEEEEEEEGEEEELKEEERHDQPISKECEDDD